MRIKRGVTFESPWSIAGLVLALIGAYLLSSSPNLILAYGCLALGLILLPAVMSVLISKEHSIVKKQLHLGPVKITVRQQAFSPEHQLFLSKFRQNQTMNYKSLSSNTRTRSFDVLLANETAIELFDSADYQKSRAIFEQVQEYLQIHAEDQIADEKIEGK